jgi:uncharacterized membrane-anchored protein YhcB (DUF1043 family)
MEAFLTILIWLGSGFAFAVGVIFGIIITGLIWKDRKKADDIAAEVNALLKERNEIGSRQADALERVADAVETWVSHR